jgi:hypothetical protein
MKQKLVVTGDFSKTSHSLFVSHNMHSDHLSSPSNRITLLVGVLMVVSLALFLFQSRSVDSSSSAATDTLREQSRLLREVTATLAQNTESINELKV